MAGSIAKRPNGKWRARYRDESDKEHSRHFDRKIDAQQWLDQVTSAVVTGTYADPRAGQITFSAFFGEWSARQVWAPGTVLAMSLAARSVPFTDRPMKLVRHSDVETWIKQMHAAGLAPGTIKTRYVNVRSVFRAAVKDRVIGTDPTNGVRLPRGRRADAAMSIPTPEEVGQLMAVADERFRPFIALCAFAGLRLGEAAGVQLGDIDFLRRTLKVSRQIQRVTGGAIDVRAPKYGSERVVFLADSLVNILTEHVGAHGTSGKDRWLFAGEGDDPPHQNTVGYWWRKALTDASLSQIKLHDLRHFYASGLIAAGCDVVTVQRSLGHSKATTTLNTYAHLWPTAEDRTRRAAESIISESLGAPDAPPGGPAAPSNVLP
ncbi:tyrosine-type recombinase/integrase [Nocardioides hwasunensis]|uniref:Site-specific integrase n=1 Tax=Nocardioides hwasunensis TaxID=397258 RepID=A0ABR8MJ42_9ACTN|nr:site-specific integrase [Nocardioides hwasunensis]MBD3915081.1 site-specific integrase [Nocardioides hwasunensis]